MNSRLGIRWALGAVMAAIVVTAASSTTSCTPSDSGVAETNPGANEGTPLPQDDRIPMEILGRDGVSWSTVHPTRAAVEKLAQTWCAAERGYTTDTKLCGGDAIHNDMLTVIKATSATDVETKISAAEATKDVCLEALCYERNDICAGFMLEELARSPLQRVLDRSLYPNVGLSFSLYNMDLTPLDISRTDSVLMDVGPTQLRFQPLTASGRAAALRGALDRFQASTQAADLMRTQVLTTPASTCYNAFAQRDTLGQKPPVMADGAGAPWTELFLTTFVNGANEYPETLARSVTATREAAEVGPNASASGVDVVATQWNGARNSAAAVAKFLAYGDETAPVVAVSAQGLVNGCHATKPTQNIGVNGVPVCPPINNNPGVQKVLSAVRGMKLSVIQPLVVARPFSELFVAAFNEDQATTNKITTPLSKVEVLAQVGASQADLDLAENYLCSETRAFASIHTPIASAPKTLPAGFEVIPRSNGVATPAALPARALAAHFMGATHLKDSELADPTLSDYGNHGAIRALDHMKFMTSDFMAAAPFAKVRGKFTQMMTGFQSSLEAQAGDHRLEFWIGFQVTGASDQVDSVQINIHGVKSGESFGVVQGVDGLKCVMTGAIDGAPCATGDYLLPFSGSVGALDSKMTDLKGGTLTQSLSGVPRPGNASAPISIGDAPYVVRMVNSHVEAFGGVIPTPGPTPLQGTNLAFSRHLFVPVGGSYDDVLKNAIAPDSDDCSHVATSCAGLPVAMVPPLESEINGDPSSAVGYERSWQQYLDQARQAATAADTLGVELLNAGLAIDVRRETAIDDMEKQCGANATADGCPGLNEIVDLVSFGDKQLCSWTVNGVPCVCPVAGNCPNGLTGCSVVAPTKLSGGPGDTDLCRTAILAFADQGVAFVDQFKVVPVPDTLNLAQTPAGPTPGGCSDIAALRSGLDPSVIGSDPAAQLSRREEVIRRVAAQFTPDVVRRIASGMRYSEGFADNYTLTYGETEIFNTNRRSRPSENGEVAAPCVVRPEDRLTQSSFWTRPVSCFVSGDPKFGGGRGCPPVDGVGYDGCPANVTPGDYSTLSMDTEQDALKNRWAWGFGHLRRSVATLGVLTGKLDGMMALSRIGRTTRLNGDDMQAAPIAGWNPWGCNPGPSDQSEALWVRHCAPDGKEDMRSLALCVPPGGVRGVGSDANRYQSGRPINSNGFIANCLAPGDDDVSCFWDESRAIHSWPCTSNGIGQACTPAGLDPQMSYCSLPHHTESDSIAQHGYSSISDEGVDFWNDQATFFNDVGDGFVGSVFPDIANFPTTSPEWQQQQQAMWLVPAPDSHFCSDATDNRVGTVWRALCTSPNMADDLAALIGKDEFMKYGTIAPENPYFTREEVGHWLSSNIADGKFDNTALYLFDLRGDRDANRALQAQGKEVPFPFQYAINQRNIYDALELACHADNRPRTNTVDCGHLPADYKPTSMAEMSDLMNCFSNQVKWNIGKMMSGPLARSVINAIAQNTPLASTGVGGIVLDSLQAEVNALRAINTDFEHVSDYFKYVGDDVQKLQSIDRQSKDLQEGADLQVLVVTFDEMKAAAEAMGSISLNPMADAGAAAGFADAMIAAAASISEIRNREKIAEEDQRQKSLTVAEAIIGEVAGVRDASHDVNAQLDAFNKAAAALKLALHDISKDTGRANLGDFAGDSSDPQYVNIVDRRIYNTNLIRYEQAVDRAKRAAFIARRAIEVRFGVDLTSMSSDMSLVDAPNTWANKICDFEGIDYSKIRQPNPDATVNKLAFGAPPPVGDDFANSFAGDYVTQLESFVRSYPIDFPLKDGDDLAVISLSDDIFHARSSCIEDGHNSLYYSANFEKRSSVRVSTATKGWFVRGCANTASTPADTDWAACVSIAAMGQAAPESIAGSPQGSVGGVPLDGLPVGAVPYRIANEICVPGKGVTCPTGATNTATGSVTQLVDVPHAGQYIASLYVHRAPDADPAATSTPALQLIRLSDGNVTQVPIAPTSSQWERFQVPFQVSAGESYRLDILPSTTPVTLSSSASSVLWIAAAEVEPAFGGATTAGAWQRTDETRTVIGAACKTPSGEAMRNKFARKCSYVCKNGITTNCASTDPAALPTACYYEATFALPLENIENGSLIPSGQIAIGNFNFRHNQVGLNVVGTGVTNCENSSAPSCYENGFIQYSLTHNGDVSIRNWEGASLHAHMSTAIIEHGKALAAERVITNPPASLDQGLMASYMKDELKGRPLEGLYTLRVYDSPSMRWENISDIQLMWNYHYWTRFQK